MLLGCTASVLRNYENSTKTLIVKNGGLLLCFHNVTYIFCKENNVEVSETMLLLQHTTFEVALRVVRCVFSLASKKLV